MKFSRLALVGLALLMPTLGACSAPATPTQSEAATTAPPSGPTGGDLNETKWTLTASALDSVDLSKFGITIEFTDKTAAGTSGVNRYNATYEATDSGGLTFGPAATTRMAGSPEAMKAEEAYLAVLPTITGYTVTATQLELFADQQEMLIYAPK